MEAVEPGTVVQDSTGAAMNSIRHRCGISMFVLMAVEKEAFGGWQMSLREFNDYGIDPSRELAGIEFTGFPQDLVVYVIRDGKADAGTVRTGILESMAAEGKINLTDFRIGPYKDYGKLTFEDALSRYWYVIVLLIFVFVLTISFAAYVKKTNIMLEARVKERTDLLEHEIDKHKHDNDALRQSEEKFFKAFRATPDAILITRVADQRLIDVNDVFVRLTGYSRDEALGHNTLDLNLWVNPQDRERYLTTLQKGGSVREQEARFRMRSGKIMDGLVSAETSKIRE